MLGFGCECSDGFDGDGYSCLDLDECALDTDGCDENAICSNTHGAFECSCLSALGFILTSRKTSNIFVEYEFFSYN